MERIHGRGQAQKHKYQSGPRISRFGADTLRAPPQTSCTVLDARCARTAPVRLTLLDFGGTRIIEACSKSRLLNLETSWRHYNPAANISERLSYPLFQ